MCKRLFTLAAVGVCLLTWGGAARAQKHDAPRYEVGALFSSITLAPNNGERTEPGVGARFTININDHFALEAETTLFPNSGFSAEERASGRGWQGLFGVKAGKRWEKFGVFAKARPGFTSFSQGHFILELDNTGNFVSSRVERATHFTTDVGGVLEFYPTRRIVTRFDAGDTIIRYGAQTQRNFFPPPATFTLPAATRHNFQFSAGISFRFD